jgi:lipopolysaccharide export LptBFGC system permease protein LptF
MTIFNNNNAPGEWVIRKSAKSPAFKRACKVLYLDKISHEYFIQWHETDDPNERERIRKEYYEQVALALCVPLGINTGGAFAFYFFNAETLFTLVALIAITITFFGGGK